MGYEVELKFRLEQVQAIETALHQRGAVEKPIVSHVDRYFNHPSRDFRATDEAFRIRSVGDSNCITYKGPVLGNVAKTRHEIEVDVADGPEVAERLIEMMKCLGFRFVREVRKMRREFALNRDHRVLHELALDEVPELGCFLEIELLADDEDRESAESAVWDLARSLGLTASEPRSYLDLLIELDGHAAENALNSRRAAPRNPMKKRKRI